MKLILITILAIPLIAFLNVGATPNLECPAGYSVLDFDESGNVICKAPPTGCPYGDSLPMEKCEPLPTDQSTDEPEKIEPQEPPVFEGK